MKTFVITGAASGIGAAVKAQLEGAGAKVYNVDLKNADCCVDLSVPAGREEAIRSIHELFAEGIDGLVCCAGVGGACGNPRLMMAVNYYGAVAMAEGCFELLRKKNGACVLLSSNSIAEGYTIMDFVNMALTDGMEEITLQTMDGLDSSRLGLGSAVYITSKYALTLWMRRHSATWGARGVRINCVAPGTTRTPMCANMGEKAEKALNALPIPITYHKSLMLEPEDVAQVICFLLSGQSKAIHGMLLFADGGTEAAINTERVY